VSQEKIKKAVTELIESIKNKPDTAKAVYRAEVSPGEGLQVKARVRNFPEFVMDEPPVVGGKDSGMGPPEALLAALGACQEILYLAYAAVMEIPLKSVKIDVRGYMSLKGQLSMDDSVAPGFTDITFDVHVDSPADEATIKKLAKAVEDHCPVMDTLVRPVPVKGTISLNGGKPQPISG
jgi:uncharacterized OsmC-like protein